MRGTSEPAEQDRLPPSCATAWIQQKNEHWRTLHREVQSLPSSSKPHRTWTVSSPPSQDSEGWLESYQWLSSASSSSFSAPSCTSQLLITTHVIIRRNIQTLTRHVYQPIHEKMKFKNKHTLHTLLKYLHVSHCFYFILENQYWNRCDHRWAK